MTSSQSFCRATTKKARLPASLKRFSASLRSRSRSTGSFAVGVSIGIALRDKGIGEGRELLRRADMAMYAAKAQGKACYVLFDPEMDLSRQARQEIATDLRQALDQNEFDLAYQPIVDARTRSIVGVEALLRWPRGPRADLRPDHFIPIAEETG